MFGFSVVVSTRAPCASPTERVLLSVLEMQTTNAHEAECGDGQLNVNLIRHTQPVAIGKGDCPTQGLGRLQCP